MCLCQSLGFVEFANFDIFCLIVILSIMRVCIIEVVIGYVICGTRSAASIYFVVLSRLFVFDVDMPLSQ